MIKRSINVSLLLIGAIFVIAACDNGGESCTETNWYEDADGDGLGN